MVQKKDNNIKGEILESNSLCCLKGKDGGRKKKKIAICIPTYNRPKILNDICSRIMYTVDEKIFDIYIYDSSLNSDSEEIINEFMQKDNFYYFRLSPSIHSNEKLYGIYQDKNIQNNYEYVWILADYLFFSKDIVNVVVNKLDEKWDMLMLDFYDPERKGNKQYYNPDQIFFEYAWSMTLFGIMIINCKTVLKSADWLYLRRKYLKVQYKNFSHLAMYFEMMLKIKDLKFYHLSIKQENVYISKYKGSKSEYFGDYLNIWGRYWYASIYALPNYYTRKDQVITKACVYTGNLGKKNVLALRTQGVLNLKSFYKCKDIWTVVSTVKPLFVWFIIFLPKSIVKIIENIDINRKIGILQLKIFCKKYDELYVYGAGIKAKKMANLLEENRIGYKAFIVSDIENNSRILMEHNVISISQLHNLNDIGIILAMNNQNKKEVIPLLYECGYKHLFLWDVV